MARSATQMSVRFCIDEIGRYLLLRVDDPPWEKRLDG